MAGTKAPPPLRINNTLPVSENPDYNPLMLIRGIDLSSQPRDTAACMIDFRDGEVLVAPPQLGCDDDRLDTLIARADAVGIDAPLGWPRKFVEAVAGWMSPTWNNELRDRLRFRLTDCEVRRQTRQGRYVAPSKRQAAASTVEAVLLWFQNQQPNTHLQHLMVTGQ